MAWITRRRLAIIVGAAGLGVLLLAFGQMLVTRYEVGQQADALRAEITALREENAALERDLRYWQSDEGIERRAREQLGWAKPGETLVVVAATPSAREASGDQRSKPTSRPPNWRRWVTLIFGS